MQNVGKFQGINCRVSSCEAQLEAEALLGVSCVL